MQRSVSRLSDRAFISSRTLDQRSRPTIPAQPQVLLSITSVHSRIPLPPSFQAEPYYSRAYVTPLTHLDFRTAQYCPHCVLHLPHSPLSLRLMRSLALRSSGLSNLICCTYLGTLASARPCLTSCVAVPCRGIPSDPITDLRLPHRTSRANSLLYLHSR